MNVKTASYQQTGNIMASIAYIAPVMGWIPTLSGLPLIGLSVLIAGIIWFVYRNKYDEVASHGKESLNYQISINVYFAGIVGIVLSLSQLSDPNVAIKSIVMLAGGAIILLVMLYITLTFIAAYCAYTGKEWRFPFIFRWIK